MMLHIVLSSEYLITHMNVKSPFKLQIQSNSNDAAIYAGHVAGTWNHRLTRTGTGHALKSSVGGPGLQKIGDEDLERYAVVLKNNSQNNSEGIEGPALRVEEISDSFELRHVPSVVRLGLDQDAVAMIRPKFVHLKHERGVFTEGNNTPSAVMCSISSPLVSGMDRPKQETDVQRKIPEAWPSRWVTANPLERKITLAFSPSKDAKQGHAGKHPVTSRPLFNRLFDSIEYSDSVNIKDVVLGVQRTAGLTIRYRVDDSYDAVFGQMFNTQGIRHTLSEDILSDMDDAFERFEELPFDTDALSIFRTILKESAFHDLANDLQSQISSEWFWFIFIFTIKEFPGTIGEAIKLILQNEIGQDTMEHYLGSLHKHQTENVRSTLEPILEKFNFKKMKSLNPPNSLNH